MLILPLIMVLVLGCALLSHLSCMLRNIAEIGDFFALGSIGLLIGTSLVLAGCAWGLAINHD